MTSDPVDQIRAGWDYIKAGYGDAPYRPYQPGTAILGTPVRAWLLPSVKPRAFQHCNRWHHRWRTPVSATAVDCNRCGLRWSW